MAQLDGLQLQTLTDAQRDALLDFYLDVYVEHGGEGDRILRDWIGDVISGHHPMMQDEYCFFITDPSQNDRIVSATLLIPQTWRYDGIPLQVGRVEFVATHKDYRGRGLVRRLMHEAHQLSASLGQNIQVITGIPHFYRQFGYTMAVKFAPEASLNGAAITDGIPKLMLQRATVNDIPQLSQWYDAYAAQNLLSSERPPEMWRYDMEKRRPKNPGARHYYLIMDGQRALGYVGVRDTDEYRGIIVVDEYVVSDQSSYLVTYNDVILGLKKLGQTRFGEKFHTITFEAGIHPTVKTLIEHKKTYVGHVRPWTYAWYFRAASPAQFMRDIAPVLERRLMGSGAHGYSGEFKITFHDKMGLIMKFEDGRLIDATDTRIPQDQEDAGLPWHLFLNMVVGQHTLIELRKLLPDVTYSGEAVALLEILFPVRPSWVIGIA